MDQPFLSNSHVAGVTPALPGGPFIRKLCLFIMFVFYLPAAGDMGRRPPIKEGVPKNICSCWKL